MCSGNTCRSPLAEGIANKLLAGREDIEVASAGTSAFEGSPASENSLQVAARHDIDISAHRSRLLNRKRVEGADLIVTMATGHRETIAELAPDALGRTYLLTDFCDEHSGDIADPVGGGIDTYERTYMMIRRCVETLVARIDLVMGTGADE